MKKANGSVRLVCELRPRTELLSRLNAIFTNCFQKYSLFVPKKYGDYYADQKIETKEYQSLYPAMAETLAQTGFLTVQTGQNSLQIFSDETKNAEATLLDKIVVRSGKKKNPLIDSIELSDFLINLTEPAISFCGAEELVEASQKRWKRHNGYESLELTVRDYGCGLKNAFWRMWFGKKYVDFIGKERLDRAPKLTGSYENGIYFVQLYRSPFDWKTPDGILAAEAFKKAVGKEMFYDLREPEKKLIAPDFGIEPPPDRSFAPDAKSRRDEGPPSFQYSEDETTKDLGLTNHTVSFATKKVIDKKAIFPVLENYVKTYCPGDPAYAADPQSDYHNAYRITLRRIDYTIICDFEENEGGETILNFRIPLCRPDYYYSESERLLQFMAESLDLRGDEAIGSGRLVEKLTESRRSLSLKNFHHFNDPVVFNQYLAYQKKWIEIHGRYGDYNQYGDATLAMPSTGYIAPKNEKRSYVAALCPKPTPTLFPPVDFFILFKDYSAGISPGSPRGMLNAPVVPYEEVIALLKPFLTKLPECPSVFQLSLDALMADHYPEAIERFEQIWRAKSQYPKLKNFDFLDLEQTPIVG